MLSDKAMLQLFPEGYWAHNNRHMKSLGGSVVTIKGPIRLPVKFVVCKLCTSSTISMVGAVSWALTDRVRQNKVAP